VILALFLERRHAEDAGAVDEHVETAEAGHGRRHERLGMLAAGDLAGHDQRPLAGGVEVRLRCFEHRGAGAAQHHRRALGEEPARGRPADPTAAARDQNHLAVVHGDRLSY
jgi:hypothetical protein